MPPIAPRKKRAKNNAQPIHNPPTPRFSIPHTKTALHGKVQLSRLVGEEQIDIGASAGHTLRHGGGGDEIGTVPDRKSRPGGHLEGRRIGVEVILSADQFQRAGRRNCHNPCRIGLARQERSVAVDAIGFFGHITVSARIGSRCRTSVDEYAYGGTFCKIDGCCFGGCLLQVEPCDREIYGTLVKRLSLRACFVERAVVCAAPNAEHADGQQYSKETLHNAWLNLGFGAPDQSKEDLCLAHFMQYVYAETVDNPSAVAH